MAFMNDEVFDQGLDWAIANGTRLDIVTTDPGGTFATVTANSVGNETVTLSATADAATGTGRRTTVPAVTAGTVTATDTATHWAITNGTDTVVASGALSASQAVTLGNPWTLSAFDLILRDPTA